MRRSRPRNGGRKIRRSKGGYSDSRPWAHVVRGVQFHHPSGAQIPGCQSRSKWKPFASGPTSSSAIRDRRPRLSGVVPRSGLVERHLERLDSGRAAARSPVVKSILLALALCSPCLAQTKLWEWSAPSIDHGEFYASDILSSASDAAGNTAVLLGEVAAKSGQNVVNHVRVLWISGKGKELFHSTYVSPHKTSVLLGEETGLASGGKWKVLFVSGNKLIATDGKSMYLGRVKAGKVTMTVEPAPEGGFPQASGAAPTFQGWLQIQGAPIEYSFFPAPGAVQMTGDGYRLTSLALWRY